MVDFIGSASADVFTGGDDADTASGAGGNDTLTGDRAEDLLVGNAGADVLNGGAGEDRLFSGDETPPFNFPYYGDPYTPPLLDRGTEVDRLIGGADSDRLFAGYGDHVDGGEGGAAGDYLYISFMGGQAGVVANFDLVSQVIGGGVIRNVENISWIEGSEFDDDISVGGGTPYGGFPVVSGMGGNDRLVAGYYTGVLYGDAGDDVLDGRGSQYLRELNGGDGDDTLYTPTNTFSAAYGGAGNDTIHSHGSTYGGSGDDIISIVVSSNGGAAFGEDGDDTISTAASASVLLGGNGADTVTGGEGDDALYAATVNEQFEAIDDAGLERDVLSGLAGNDTLYIGLGDSADGGSGIDTLRLSLAGATAGVTLNTAGLLSAQPFAFAGGTIVGMERLTHLRGGDFADVLTIATQGNLLTIDAGAGNDVVTAGSSSVVLAGGEGDDTFVSGLAGDQFNGGEGLDTISYARAGAAVVLNVGSGFGAGGDQLTDVENLTGSAFGDALTGDGGANVLSGGAGADALAGGDGNDRLLGGDGADVLGGGAGVDVVDGGAGSDAIDFREKTAALTLTLAGAVTSTARMGGVVEDAVRNVESIYGGAGGDVFTGDAQANFINGFAGNDVLRGGGGNDRLLGSAGVDTADYRDKTAAVAVTLNGGADAVVSVGGVAEDVIGNIEIVYGGAAADRLTGDGAANLFRGAEGADVIDGGAGVDAVDFRDKTAAVVLSLLGATVATASVGGVAEDRVRNVEDVYGGLGADGLAGDANANALFGGAGADTLRGGLGADRLSGGADADRFVYNTVAESTTAARDAITDFRRTEGDRIVLNLIDADSTVAGNQAFTVGALAAGQAGRLAVVADGSNRWLVLGDVDGDGAADLAISVISFTAPGAADFVL